VKRRYKHNKSYTLKEELCEQEKQCNKTLHSRMKNHKKKPIEQEVKKSMGDQSKRKFVKS
jgi:hypothetical protein